MPLLHQTVTRPFRLNRQAIKHSRLTDREIADVDHLLHFAFAFGDNFSGLERNELTKLVFQFAERVSQTANSVAANGPGSLSPFLKSFLRARNRRFVIVVRRRANAGELCSINRRDLVDLRAAAAPLAVEDAGIFLAEREFFEHRLHCYFRFRQYCRIESIASSTTFAVMSSAGRKRIEQSPDRNVSTPRSNNPFQNLSRVSPSGRSNARNNPRPRTAVIIDS